MSYLNASCAVRCSSERKAVAVVDRRKGQSQYSLGADKRVCFVDLSDKVGPALL